MGGETGANNIAACHPSTHPKILYDAIQASGEVAVQHAAKLAENIFRPTPHGATLPRVKKRPSQAQLTPDCPVSDFSDLSVLPDISPEPPIHSPTIPENFENFHFFHDFDPPGMVSDDSESMVPLGDHLTSPVKILTRSLIIHGHVSKLEIFHTLLKTLFPPPSCMHPDSRSTCSTCSESLLYSIISVRRKISAHWSAFFLDIIPRHFQAVMNHLCAQRHMRWNIRAARDNSLYPRSRSNTPIKPSFKLAQDHLVEYQRLVSKRNDLREHIAEVKPLLLMLQETNLDTNAFRFTAPKYSFIQHPASGPGKRGIALGFLAVLPAREIEGVPGTLILAKVPWSHGATANFPDGCDSDTVTNRLLDIINPNTAFSSLSNLPLIDTPVPVQHRRLYRATTKKAICKAKNAYRAWLASRNLYFEFTGNHTSMHPRKAPGDDGITTALMQAIAHDPKDHGTGDVNLDRPGALALLRVANTIFLSGVIPKVWRCATIISIPNKGDATLASNLRGISLINVGLKILCKMVQARLSSLLESNNVLVPEQGWV
ncbi:hypothetical protein BASA83_006732 [Batrachochytrium salamandrivorans]|nr:hypothetical protein BASA83_006732 [Batrachochytrium salamandrivorans]